VTGVDAYLVESQLLTLFSFNVEARRGLYELGGKYRSTLTPCSVYLKSSGGSRVTPKPPAMRKHMFRLCSI